MDNSSRASLALKSLINKELKTLCRSANMESINEIADSLYDSRIFHSTF